MTKLVLAAAPNNTSTSSASTTVTTYTSAEGSITVVNKQPVKPTALPGMPRATLTVRQGLNLLEDLFEAAHTEQQSQPEPTEAASSFRPGTNK